MKARGVRLHGANDLRLEEFELPEITDDEITDHYKQVLLNIRDETEEVLRLMEKPRMDRKAIRETLNLIVKMIGREK